MIRIIDYDEKYRDDMIFCLLLAKDALGKTPRLNEDLLDVTGNFSCAGGAFWLAVDGGGRVIGMLGVRREADGEWWLKRFYVKPSHKNQGIGTALLRQAERVCAEKGARSLHTRFSDDYAEAARFYPSRGFHDAGMSDGKRHFVKTL